MAVSIVPEGDEFPKALEKHARKVTPTMRNALRVVAELWKNDAQDVVPVDTGQLRNSIRGTVEVTGGKVRAVVGTNVEHGLFVELGTDTIAGGKLKLWREGDPPIRFWEALEKRGGMDQQMPWLRPTGIALIPRAKQVIRKMFVAEIKRQFGGKRFK